MHGFENNFASMLNLTFHQKKKILNSMMNQPQFEQHMHNFEEEMQKCKVNAEKTPENAESSTPKTDNSIPKTCGQRLENQMKTCQNPKKQLTSVSIPKLAN